VLKIVHRIARYAKSHVYTAPNKEYMFLSTLSQYSQSRTNAELFSFQAGPSSEANFDNVVRQAQRSGNASPTAATCDTASVRSLDTSTATNNPDEMMENEPQDLSIGGAMSSASSVSNMDAGGDEPVPSTSKGQVGSNDQSVVDG
jgi:hypothetical protein